MRTLLVLTGLVAALASARTAEAQEKTPAPIPGWLPDLDAGFAEARRSGKPMLVVFR